MVLTGVCSPGLVKAPLKRSRSTADGADEESQELLQEQGLEAGGAEEEQRTDNTSLLRLLEDGEKVRECSTTRKMHVYLFILFYGNEYCK